MSAPKECPGTCHAHHAKNHDKYERDEPRARYALPLHTCPYASEIHEDDTTLCECCEMCSYECAMDI